MNGYIINISILEEEHINNLKTMRITDLPKDTHKYMKKVYNQVYYKRRKVRNKEL